MVSDDLKWHHQVCAALQRRATQCTRAYTTLTKPKLLSFLQQYGMGPISQGRPQYPRVYSQDDVQQKWRE